MGIMKELKVHPIFFSDAKCKRGWQPKPKEVTFEEITEFKKKIDVIGFSCDQCAVMSWRTELAVSRSKKPLSTKEGMKDVVWSVGLTSYNPSDHIFFPHPLKVDKLFIHYFTMLNGDCAWNLSIYEESTCQV